MRGVSCGKTQSADTGSEADDSSESVGRLQGPADFRRTTSNNNDNLILGMKIKPAENHGGIRVELRPGEEAFPFAVHAMAPVLPVIKLKEILVPVDFSECTEKALAYAVPLAQQFNATLTLLHVVEPTFMPASEMGVVVELEGTDDAAKRLEQLRRRIAGPVRCRTVVKSGVAESEIIGVARESDCDLIILSTHGRSGMERLLLGSTMEKVVRRAGCPILVVRPHEHDFVTDSATGWEAGDEALESEIETEMRTGI